MSGRRDYDVIVAGGGPAGATAATLTAMAGWQTLLVERSPEPRFKIGESLMPATYWTLERLGMLPAMRASHFPRKHSIQFFSRTGKASAPFYFAETDPFESAVTWQVLRSEFDAMLLANAAEKGVEVRWGANVREVLFDPERPERAIGVRFDESGQPVDLAARVVVDATGQSVLIAKRLGLRRPDPELRKATYFSHFAGAWRDSGIDEGATLVLHTDNQEAWFWYIPLPNDRVSVGVVGGLDYLITGRSPEPQRVFDEEVARCPAVAERIAGSRQVFPIQALRDFSYRATRVAGDGWVLAGDAFGFLDPIYSSGVFLALRSGEFAADAIDAALRADDPSAARLGAWGPRFAAGMEAMRRLVYAFYAKDFSFARFLAAHPQCRADIVHLLTGNVFRQPVDGLFERLATMSRMPVERPLEEVAEPAVPDEVRR